MIAAIGLLSASCGDGTTPDDSLKLNEDGVPMDIIIEVAQSIKGYNNLQNNLYTSKDEFEGNCSDFALLFALKTGAKIVSQDGIPNNITLGAGQMPDGVYEIMGIDPDIDLVLRDAGEKVAWQYYNPAGRTPGSVFGKYHPMIGAYLLKRVADYTSGFDGDGDPHMWNLLNNINIDVTVFDDTGDWHLAYFR
jgi:hypothetical protein